MPSAQSLTDRGGPRFSVSAPEREPANLEELLKRQQPGAAQTNGRKKLAAQRRRILCETFESDVSAEIAKIFRSGAVREAVRRHVTVAVNLGLDVVTAESVIYKQGVRRSLGKSGSKASRQAFLDMYEESRIDSLAPMLNRFAAFVGPVLEVPWVRGGKLRREIHHADEFDVILDPDDPLGPPIAAAWSTWHTGEQLIHVLDEETRRTYKASDPDSLISSRDHGVTDGEGNPVFPGSIWRYDQPWDPMDWWVASREAGLVDATIRVAAWSTILDWVRKTQNRKVIALFGNLDTMPQGQTLHAELPLLMNVDEGEALPQLTVHDLAVKPDDFVSHILYYTRTQTGRRGIPQIQYDYAGDVVPAQALSMQHERLSQRRNEQKVFAREIEKSSAWKSVSIAKNLGHHAADALPDPDAVREHFSLEIPELNRMEDPKTQREHLDWMLGRGGVSDVEIEMARNPDLTEDQAKEQILARLEVQAELNELKASRRSNGDEVMQTEAQETGAMGPEVRDGGQAEDENENERRDDDAGNSGIPG